MPVKTQDRKMVATAMGIPIDMAPEIFEARNGLLNAISAINPK
jgi:hypothetical protein